MLNATVMMKALGVDPEQAKQQFEALGVNVGYIAASHERIEKRQLAIMAHFEIDDPVKQTQTQTQTLEGNENG